MLCTGSKRPIFGGTHYRLDPSPKPINFEELAFPLFSDSDPGRGFSCDSNGLFGIPSEKYSSVRST